MGSDANREQFPAIEPVDDGLLIPDVGRWSKRKYHFLGRFLRQFSTGMKNKWPERHYIDLFAGAGFARLQKSGEIVAGSPVLAANCPDQFTIMHFCEADPNKLAALQRRLSLCNNRCRFTSGDANDQVDRILEAVPQRDALCVTFADPFGLHLDFETVRLVASRRSDLIILLADNMDAARNWAAYYLDDPDSSLDRFMGEPGWREQLLRGSNDVAGKLRSRYIERLRSVCGYDHIDTASVCNDHGRDIYSLVFASRSSLGLKFWHNAGSVDEGGQRALFGDGA